MNKLIKPFVMIFMGIGFIFLASGCGDKRKGACVRGSGITSTCGDDFTVEQCDYMNGTFYENETCADLGYSPN